MYLNKWDSTEVLLEILDVMENVEYFQYTDPVLVILAKCIGIAPLTSLKDLLKLCKYVLPIISFYKDIIALYRKHYMGKMLSIYQYVQKFSS